MTMATWMFGAWAVKPTVTPPSTLDPTKTGANLTLSGGNLTVTNTVAATWAASIGTLSHSSGKFYFEAAMVVDVAGNMVVGLMDATTETWNAYFIGQDTHSWGYVGVNGDTVHNTSFTSFGATYAQGDVIGVAVDFGTGNAWFAKNNTYQASGNPATGANPALTGLSGPLFPGISLFDSTNQITVAFSSGNSFSPPSGFSLWG
jgi:hypothetical protein